MTHEGTWRRRVRAERGEGTARRPLAGDLPRPRSVHGMRASERARSLARMHAPTYALMDARSYTRARPGGAPMARWRRGCGRARTPRAARTLWTCRGDGPHDRMGPAGGTEPDRIQVPSRPPVPPRAWKRQFEREGVATLPLTLLSVRIIKVFPYCETRRTGQFQKKVGAHKLSEHKDMNNDNMEPLGRRAPRTVVKWTFVQKVPELLHFGAKT